MRETKNCMLCGMDDHVEDFGEYRLCEGCRLSVMQDALEFAKSNTFRGTAYHAAFRYMAETLVWKIKEAAYATE